MVGQIEEARPCPKNVLLPVQGMVQNYAYDKIFETIEMSKMLNHLGNKNLIGSPFKNVFTWEQLQSKLEGLQRTLKDVGESTAHKTRGDCVILTHRAFKSQNQISAHL